MGDFKIDLILCTFWGQANIDIYIYTIIYLYIGVQKTEKINQK